MEYFMAIWYILCFFDIFFHFGMLYREKSGNPAPDAILMFSFRPVAPLTNPVLKRVNDEQ
jgi:hypothetical protein